MNRRNRQFRAGVTLLDGAVTIPYLAAGALRVGDRNCRAHRYAGDGRTVREDASILTTAPAATVRQSSDNSFDPMGIGGAGQGCIRLNTTLKDGENDAAEIHAASLCRGIRLRGWFVPPLAGWGDCRAALTP